MLYTILYERRFASTIVRQCMVTLCSFRRSGININSQHQQKQQLRHFVVRELPWCKTPNSNFGDQKNKSKKNNLNVGNDAQPKSDDDDSSIGKKMKFGIVAAMDEKTRTMGINGSLPWNLPKDRKMFVSLTRNKVLVIGKHTFYERPNQSHIRHARHCIVVSKTLAASQNVDNKHPSDTSTTTVTFVSSFSEALYEAHQLADDIQYKIRLNNDNNDNDALDCWIAGGQRLYEEAIRHPLAFKMHLTLVQGDATAAEENNLLHVAKFPPKYRWDQKFEETQRIHVNDDHQADHKYTFIEYVRRKMKQ